MKAMIINRKIWLAIGLVVVLGGLFLAFPALGLTSFEELGLATRQEPVMISLPEPVVALAQEPDVTSAQEPVVALAEEPAVELAQEPNVASAQEEDEASEPVEVTVAQILADPVRDQVVIVRGEIAQYLEGNEYVLDDGTGQITIEGGPPWYHQVDLPVGQEVSVTGEVSVGPPWLEEPRTPEIDLFSITLADGTVTSVREAGRPPWAGGPNKADKAEWKAARGQGPPPWAGGPNKADKAAWKAQRKQGPPPWAGGPWRKGQK